MENNKFCSICGDAAPEDAAILALGRMGYPRYLCERCDALLGAATTERDYGAISRAFDELGERIAKGLNDDEIVSEALAEILGGARERAEAIKDGSYDFTEEDELSDTETVSEDEIQCDSEGLPFGEEEELSPEEISKREKRAKLEGRLNVATNILCAVIFLGVLAYCIWKIFF